MASVFSNTRTIEQIKAENNNQPFAVVPSKNNPAVCFFACGEARGYVAKNVAAKLKAREVTGTLVVSHVKAKDFDGLMLHEQSNANAIAVF